jgi:hypothetical protein
MSGIREWLDELGLGDYAEAFEAERITREALPHLSEANLKELGLPMGPRAQVLAASKAVLVPVAPVTVEAPREAERRLDHAVACADSLRPEQPRVK